MWKDSNRNIVVIFQPNILRIVGFYVRHWAMMKNLRVRQISDEFLAPIKINIISCKTNIVIYGSGLPGLDSLTLRNEANFYK